MNDFFTNFTNNFAEVRRKWCYAGVKHPFAAHITFDSVVNKLNVPFPLGEFVVFIKSWNASYFFAATFFAAPYTDLIEERRNKSCAFLIEDKSKNRTDLTDNYQRG